MSEAKKDGPVTETIKTVVYALLIAGVFRTIFFQPFWIPSGSMKDTLLIGDFLFVNKMAYGYSRYSCPFSMCPISGRILASEPERGDIVVFRHPTNGSDFIKRLIGLPGDTVQMKNGVLFLNGKPVAQQPAGVFRETKAPQGPMQITPRCANEPVATGADCDKPRAIEALPDGGSHNILNVVDAAYAPDNTRLYTVPAGHYFFMGDNRDNSADSRIPRENGGIGFIPAENLIGRADRVMFSSAGRSLFFVWTWRPDRFFKSLT